jgi:hypothetical protein
VLQQLIAGDAAPGHLQHPLVDDLLCPVIQYADDTLLLLRATPEQLLRAKTLLDAFSRATGLQINFQKSTFVPICVPDARTAELSVLVGCVPAAFPPDVPGAPPDGPQAPCSRSPAPCAWLEKFPPEPRLTTDTH